MKLKIAMFYGGRSGEHEVSLRSAASIFDHLDRSKYDVFPIGITLEGRWYLQDGFSEEGRVAHQGRLWITQDPAREVAVIPGRGLSAGGKPLNLDLAFLIPHGTFGEDGRLQGLLEYAGLPYTGSQVMGSALGMDKDMVKQVWERHDIPVVPWLTLRRENSGSPRFWQEAEREIDGRFCWPVFVKPSNSGSSVGVSKVNGPAELRKAVEEAFAIDTKVLVEPAVHARELEVAVLGSLGREEAFGPGEIVPTHEFYDYDAKYKDPNGALLQIPAKVEAGLILRLKELAVKAFRVCEARGFARVDFFLDKDSGKLYLNEINTLPGFTSISMFPAMCMEDGKMTYAQVLDRIIEAVK